MRIIGQTVIDEDTKIKALKEELQGLKDTKKELDAKVKDLEEAISKAPAAEDYTTAIELLEKDLANAHENIKKLEQEVGILKKQVTASNKKLKQAAELLKKSDTKQKELQALVDASKKEPNIS